MLRNYWCKGYHGLKHSLQLAAGGFNCTQCWMFIPFSMVTLKKSVKHPNEISYLITLPQPHPAAEETQDK